MSGDTRLSHFNGQRNFKRHVLRLLDGKDPDRWLPELLRLPARRVVNPLFSGLYHSDDRLKWHAVTAMGAVVANLAGDDPESARVVMRRLMWNLNDESGGIGWGSPEAMGEILARSGRLASEYARILVSYLDPAGNYLEHPMLQRGVLWGVGRAAEARAVLMGRAGVLLDAFLRSKDPYHRGLALWAAGHLAVSDSLLLLEPLRSDTTRLTLYRFREIRTVTVGELATEAIGRIGCVPGRLAGAVDGEPRT